MTVTADVITKRKLILAKQLYQRAVVQAATQRGASGRIMAVIGFDLAVETALNAVLASLDASKQPERNFPSLMQVCEEAMSRHDLGSLPDRRNILRVHDLRNDAQHKAKYPNEEDVGDCRTYTRDALDKLAGQVWGISFQNISTIDVVQNTIAHTLLTRAQEHFANGEHSKAVLYSATAFQQYLERATDILVCDPIIDGCTVVTQNSEGELTPDRALQGKLEHMRVKLALTALGLSAGSYFHLRAISPRYTGIQAPTEAWHHFRDGEDAANFEPAGIEAFGWEEVENVSEEEAEFAISFCADSVAEIEMQLGHLRLSISGVSKEELAKELADADHVSVEDKSRRAEHEDGRHCPGSL
jgi:hypothetical protein